MMWLEKIGEEKWGEDIWWPLLEAWLAIITWKRKERKKGPPEIQKNLRERDKQLCMGAQSTQKRLLTIEKVSKSVDNKM